MRIVKHGADISDTTLIFWCQFAHSLDWTAKYAEETLRGHGYGIGHIRFRNFWSMTEKAA